MKITLVRHGQVKTYDKNIYHFDNIHLSKEGIEQAKKLALKLKNKKFDYIYCSNLERTRETAEEILKFHKNTPIKFVEELRELKIGEMQGKPYKDANDMLTKEYASFKPKGGESRLEFLERVKKFLNKLYKKHKNQNILLITHGGVARRINNIIQNKPPEEKDREFKQDNCCINIIEFENNKPVYKLINCTKHLK